MPMKAAIPLVFIIFVAEYNKKTYDGIYNRTERRDKRNQ